MRAGSLGDRVALQKRVIVTDAEGSSTEGWTTIEPSLPADVATLGVAERLAAAQLEAELTHQVVIRWRPDVAQAISAPGLTAGHNMRLLWSIYGMVRTLDITGVVDADEKNRTGHQLTLSCFERQV